MNEPVIVCEAHAHPETWSDPVRGRLAFRTLLGGPGSSGDLTAGVADLAPGGWLGHHRHEHAELYFVLDGAGTVEIDSDLHAVTAGTAVYIPGDSEHGVRNTGGGPLRFFYAFAAGSFDEIEYRFTGAEVSDG